jgi:predicted metal-dependent hydrolase
VIEPGEFSNLVPAASACGGQPSRALLRGIEQFNQGLFFEQHETLEDAWIEEGEPIRYLYQGILQIGVGFYHLQRRNYRGATSLLQRGMGYLAPFSPVCLGVDVARLIEDASRALREIERLGPAGIGAFDPALIPQVHLLRVEEGDHAEG